MRPEENPYRSPETVEPPALQTTAPGRGSRYFAAALTMPLGAAVGLAAVYLTTGVLAGILEGLFGAAAMSVSYGQHWAVVNFPLSLFLGATAAFAIVLRVLSETHIAGRFAIISGGLVLAPLFCAFLFQDEVHLVDLLIYGPLTVFSTALLAAGVWWLLRRAR